MATAYIAVSNSEVASMSVQLFKRMVMDYDAVDAAPFITNYVPRLGQRKYPAWQRSRARAPDCLP
jgi:hypothetical protein